jgi:hypothetical protein
MNFVLNTYWNKPFLSGNEPGFNIAGLNLILRINLFPCRACTKGPLFSFIPVVARFAIITKNTMNFAIHTKNNLPHANTLIG